MRKFSYVNVDPNDLRIFDRKCYATFAGEGELIVLLKDDETKPTNSVVQDFEWVYARAIFLVNSYSHVCYLTIENGRIDAKAAIA